MKENYAFDPDFRKESAPGSPARFWMVIRGHGQSLACAVVRHPSFAAAEMEAERLTRKCGDAFYILEAVECVQPGQFPLEYHRFAREEGR